MEVCDIFNTERFQTKKALSGVSTVNLVTVMLQFENKYNKEPELDLIPYANSENYLRQQLKISDNSVKTSDLLDYTLADDVKDAVIKLNNKHRDLIINVLDCGETAIINIKHRPSLYIIKENNPIEINKQIESLLSKVMIVGTLDKLRNLYGININYLSHDELFDQFGENIPDLNGVNGFVYNGEIYINTDLAKVDTPIHELLHIFIGGMRFLDPVLYEQIINSVEELENYDVLSRPYIGKRTRLDINEEIFISQFAKYVTDLNSFIPKLGNNTIDLILYNVNRILDSALEGNYSVLSIDSRKVFQSNLIDLSELVLSDTYLPKYLGSLSDATIHRTVANLKSKLLESGDLIEIC